MSAIVYPEERPAGESGRPLRRGWTTGACATAAAKAAYSALLGHGFPDPVEITLPRGGSAHFGLAEAAVQSESASAGVIKDAGDDPDVTHGCLVRATVRHSGRGQGVTFHAGEGVGTITLEGLQLPPGEAAINPVPRRMIADALREIAGQLPDVAVTISIPGGQELAKRTMNARLGIVGGLSILGTTGIVVPYSCSAWIHSIHRGIDVARAAGLEHIAAATGSTSERAVQVLHGLPEIALIDMGDFVGGTLKYLRRHPVPRLTLAGGFAKLAKLGQGALDLHSGRSRLDQERLAALTWATGAPDELVELIRVANTANQILGRSLAAGYPVADMVAAAARAVARATAGPAIGIDVIVVDRQGAIVGRA
jgi:cobalt-precorrin-5B (C1)-methyltransferase